MRVFYGRQFPDHQVQDPSLVTRPTWVTRRSHKQPFPRQRSSYRPPRRDFQRRWERPTATGPPGGGRQLAIPERFFPITRQHVVLIKCHHHLHQLRNGPPPTLTRQASFLATLPQPAFCDSTFSSEVKQLSQTWASSVHSALVHHYERVLSNTADFLVTTAMPSSLLPKSLQIVTSWARRQLGRKLDNDILDSSINEIQFLQRLEDPTTSNQGEQPFSFYPATSDEEAVRESPICTRGLQTSSSRRRRSTKTFKTVETQTLPGTSEASPVSVSSETNSREPSAPSARSGDPIDVDLDRNTSPPAPVATGSAPPPPPAQVTSAASDTGPPVRGRKRQHSPTRSSQVDLFGSVVSQASPPSRRSRSLSTGPPLRVTKRFVLFGDNNFSNCSHDDFDIFAHPNGKLSHFRAFLASCTSVYDDVEAFVLNISMQDMSNALTSNTTQTKFVLANARRVFPNAKFIIVPCGVQSSMNSLFNEFLRQKRPSNSTILSPPDPYRVSGGRLHESTRELIFISIIKHLKA